MANYSVLINYRITPGDRRDKRLGSKLLDLCKVYGLDPSCGLFDRLIEDSYSLILERKRKEAELSERERQLAEEKKRLYGG
jgi:hypothetical protein